MVARCFCGLFGSLVLSIRPLVSWVSYVMRVEREARVVMTSLSTWRAIVLLIAVMIGEEFYYWGASGPAIPNEFRNYDGHDVCLSGPGHMCNFPQALVESLVAWTRTHDDCGYIGEPTEFRPKHG